MIHFDILKVFFFIFSDSWNKSFEKKKNYTESQNKHFPHPPYPPTFSFRNISAFMA